VAYPIVLAHGVCRLDAMWSRAVDNADDPRRDRFHYFRGVRSMLEGRGFEVHHSSVSWAAPVAQRASELRADVSAVLAKSGAEKVNIIAHSMGGLDARHMVFDDRASGRIHERLASITSIGTPHEGSPFADWGLRNLDRLVPLAERLGIDVGAFADLTTTACRAFHRDPEVVDFETSLADHVALRSFAGRQRWLGANTLLKFSYGVLQRTEGDNDGIVSVRSARWRDAYFQRVLERTDHLNQIGWWDLSQFFALESPRRLRRRILAFYADLAHALP